LQSKLFPDAVQRETLRRRSGILKTAAFVTIPGLQRSTVVLHRAREMPAVAITPGV
jgi:hypothetical protein